MKSFETMVGAEKWLMFNANDNLKIQKKGNVVTVSSTKENVVTKTVFNLDNLAFYSYQ